VIFHLSLGSEQQEAVRSKKPLSPRFVVAVERCGFSMQPLRQRPKVFQLADPENIEPSLVSAMMPFHPSFDAVYATLQCTAEAAGLRCRRADDIWENPAVIQDVVSLIDRSSIVICDCTGRNPNVFYEIGVAHTLGREVILITQAEADIPFDLRHLRFVQYSTTARASMR
jgi:hypothetical protein